MASISDQLPATSSQPVVMHAPSRTVVTKESSQASRPQSLAPISVQHRPSSQRALTPRVSRLTSSNKHQQQCPSGPSTSSLSPTPCQGRTPLRTTPSMTMLWQPTPSSSNPFSRLANQGDSAFTTCQGGATNPVVSSSCGSSCCPIEPAAANTVSNTSNDSNFGVRPSNTSYLPRLSEQESRRTQVGCPASSSSSP